MCNVSTLFLQSHYYLTCKIKKYNDCFIEITMNSLNIFHFYYIFVIVGGYVNKIYLFINNSIVVVIHLCKQIILNNIHRNF